MEGCTALILASFCGLADCAQLLLAAGADPHHANLEGMTVLMFASARGHAECTSVLLEACPNKHAMTEGSTALSRSFYFFDYFLRPQAAWLQKAVIAESQSKHSGDRP
mmetsp:Transcript_35119/g.81247  ORF Transcript_35119/g.81247 Transcript_35119/m.81247 type:complete len:108 (+) Transcript_35119:549-872(+)